MKGLVLSGGGAKGAYEVGVIKALDKLGYKPKIVTGTSIGSVNAALYIQGGYRLLYKFWTHTNLRDLIDIEDIDKMSEDMTKARFKLVMEVVKNFGLSSQSFYDRLKLVINEDKIRKSDIDFGLVTFNVSNLKPEKLYKDEIEEGKLLDYILASCSCFPTLKGTVIEDSLYIDGAYADNMPIELALKRGATEIIAVDLKSIGIYNKNFKGSNSRSKKDAGKDIDIKYISCNKSLGDMILFTKEDIKRNIKRGYIDTLKSFDKCFGNKLVITPLCLERIRNKSKNVVDELEVLYYNDENNYSDKADMAESSEKIKEFKNNILGKIDKNIIYENLKKIENEIKNNIDDFIKESLDNIADYINDENCTEHIYNRYTLRQMLYFKFMFHGNSKLNKKLEDVTRGEKIDNELIEEILNTKDNAIIIKYILRLFENIKNGKNQRKLKVISVLFKKEFKTSVFIRLAMNW